MSPCPCLPFLNRISARSLTMAMLAVLFIATPDLYAQRERDGRDPNWDRKSNLLREEGSVYLEDFLPRGEKLRVPVAPNANIFYKPDFERYLGTLRPDQRVEVVAILDKGRAFRIRGKAQQGDVVGWVPKEALPELPKQLVEDLIKAGERHATVEQLIAEKAVAMGMTQEEVERSLGKPERLSSRVSGKDGASAEWHYITYETIPQQVTGYDSRGRLVTSTQYVKVPSGKLTVIFGDGVVETIEKSEGIDDTAVGSVKLVARPIILHY